MHYRVLIYLPGQIGVGDQDGGDNVMRHHDREVLAASLPGNESTDAVDVEATLAHVEEHDREAAQVSNHLGMFVVVVVVVVKEDKRMRKIWYGRSKIKKGRKGDAPEGLVRPSREVEAGVKGPGLTVDDE